MLPPEDEAAIYDAVQQSAVPPAQPAPAEPVDAEASHEVAQTGQQPSLAITVALLIALLVSSLVLLVAGLSLAAKLDAATAVVVAAIALGGSLLIWHLQALIRGSGRRTAMINRAPWANLVVVAAFGITTGFSLFDMLTGVRSAPRTAMLVAGLVGLVAALISFIRDTDLKERGLRTVPRPAPIVQPEPEPEPEPQVFFDPTEGTDELRPRGSWPQPRRGSAADASLWDAPQFEDEPELPRRARRAADD